MCINKVEPTLSLSSVFFHNEDFYNMQEKLICIMMMITFRDYSKNVFYRMKYC